LFFENRKEFDLATGYVVGKMRGANDVEILDTMLTKDYSAQVSRRVKSLPI
jgi:hypothetical protein